MTLPTIGAFVTGGGTGSDRLISGGAVNTLWVGYPVSSGQNNYLVTPDGFYVFTVVGDAESPYFGNAVLAEVTTGSTTGNILWPPAPNYVDAGDTPGFLVLNDNGTFTVWDDGSVSNALYTEPIVVPSCPSTCVAPWTAQLLYNGNAPQLQFTDSTPGATAAYTFGPAPTSSS